MKPSLSFLCVVLALTAMVVSSCSGDDDSWDINWDKPLDEATKGLSGPMSLWDVVPETAVIEGKHVSPDEAEALLRAEAALPPSHPVSVTVSRPGTLRKAIGRDAFTMDALTVSGPLDYDDLVYIRRCATSCRLHRVDLAKATLENDEMPDFIFMSIEYSKKVLSPVYVPIHTLVLPENLRQIGPYALINLLVTKLDLPESLEGISDGGLAHTILLGGEFTINENMKLGFNAFCRAGDGSLVINYNKSRVDMYSFVGAYLGEFNMTEGVVEVLESYALAGVRGLETITLPRSLKFMDEYSMAYISDLKTLNVLFDDPTVAPLDLEKADATNRLICAFGNFDSKEPGTPHDVKVNVPEGKFDDFRDLEKSLAWQWFDQFQ